MKNKLIIFNWKMGPSSAKEAERLFKIILNSKVVVAPPFIYLSNLKTRNLKFGAQNCFWENSGAYTGEISPKMLKNLGVEYVIIGHSERRYYMRETDEMINKKVKAALKAGLKVVLCVGETKKGLNKAENYVRKQLQRDFKKLSFNSRVIIAYEPVWSISTSGTGKVCPPEYALKMIKFIKKLLATNYKPQTTKVLYGGSVDGKNIKKFVKYLEIDGALVGGASLKPQEVKKIIKITR
jgi:triosephosphate isomerase